MLNLLFYCPLYYYEVQNWEKKKDALFNSVSRNSFERHDLNNFLTDQTNRTFDYSDDFSNIFSDELSQFMSDISTDLIEITRIWTVKYLSKGSHHCPHNHKSTGYTGLLYHSFDPEVHEPVRFIGPWNNPVTDKSIITSLPDPKEGVMYIWPSHLVHYVDPMTTDKLRMVTSWDMDVK